METIKQVTKRATIAQIRSSKSSKYFEKFSSKRFFFNWLRASNSAVHSWIWPNFKLIRDYIVVLVTCKNEEDPIKNEGTRVLTSLYRFFRCSRAAYSAVSCGIPPQFKLIQAFMLVFLTCKIENLIKNERARVLTRFLPL